MTREATFWSKVNKTDTCWLWAGGQCNLEAARQYKARKREAA